MIPSRPKINDEESDKIANYFFPKSIPELLVIGVRGYFLNSVGKKNENDFMWDDAVIVYENGSLIKTFNGNTDPSKHKSDLAMLDTGVYQFAKGTHKNRIKAFRAYPEGVRLKCKRENSKGVWKESLCSAINFHDGGLTDTWSAGCQTIVNQGKQKQFDEFRDLVYRLMTRHKLKTFTYLLITQSQMQTALNGEISEIVSSENTVPEVKKNSAAVPAFSPAEGSPSDASDAQSFDSPAAVEKTDFDQSSQSEPSPDNFGNTIENFGEKMGGFIEEKEKKIEDTIAQSSETVRETIETESGKIEKQTTEITDKFSPRNLPAFIPQISRLKTIILTAIPGGAFLSTLASAWAKLPDWAIYVLCAITAIALWKAMEYFIRHHEKVLDFITKCYETTANPAMDNLIPIPPEQNFVGYRRNELFSALLDKK